MNQPNPTNKKKNFDILFTCIGRRVSLLNSFRTAAKTLKLKAGFLGTDQTELSPALQLCDKQFILKPVNNPGYIRQVLSVVRQNRVRLLVPTVDLDLKVLAANKAKFAKLGCCVLVSEPQVIDICQDKRKTYRFLTENGLDTPVTISARKALSMKKHTWPYFVKPWDGYAGRGNAVVRNCRQLSFYAARIPNPICQQLIVGTEYTCDAYVDMNGEVRSVVPRRRIEVRSGEVSKAQTVKHPRIMKRVAELAEKLGAGPGVITVQLFLTETGAIKFIEVNPRFGGGVPLSIKAGANFPKWILQELTGKKPRIQFDGFDDGLTMLRYDAEVWMRK